MAKEQHSVEMTTVTPLQESDEEDEEEDLLELEYLAKLRETNFGGWRSVVWVVGCLTLLVAAYLVLSAALNDHTSPSDDDDDDNTVTPTFFCQFPNSPGWCSNGTETHVVSVYRGATGIGTANLVEILVDRAWKNVTLVLGSALPVRWSVLLAPDTSLSKVHLLGDNVKRCTLNVSGEMIDDVERHYISVKDPYDGEPQAAQMIAQVLGFGGIDSYQSAAQKAFFIVDSVDDKLEPNYLDTLVQDASEGLAERDVSLEHEAVFNDYHLSVGGNSYVVPVSVPRVSWAIGLEFYYDDFYGSTFQRGHEDDADAGGYLFRCHMPTNTWSVVASLHREFAGLLYDGGRLITGFADHHDGTMSMAVVYNATMRTLHFSYDEFPGYLDLWNPASATVGPYILPLDADHNRVLMRTATSNPDAEAYRTYVVDLATNNVTLVAFAGRCLSEDDRRQAAVISIYTC